MEIYIYIHTHKTYTKAFLQHSKVLVPQRKQSLWARLAFFFFFLMGCHLYPEAKNDPELCLFRLGHLADTFSWKWTWASSFKKITDRWQFTVLPLIKVSSQKNQILENVCTITVRLRVSQYGQTFLLGSIVILKQIIII